MKKGFIMAAVFVLLGAGCASGSSVTEGDSDSTSPPPTGRTSGSDALTATPPMPTSAPQDQPPRRYAFPGVLPEQQIADRQIRIRTEKGDIVFELFDEEAPKAVSNIVYLTKEGFYNGLTFHRREEGFVIQGGDPAGNGTGGPGYTFEDEPVEREYTRGIVAMANRGPDTNGSQFFIMLADRQLDPDYTIFGRVTEGMDVVDEIAIGDVMNEVQVEALGARL